MTRPGADPLRRPAPSPATRPAPVTCWRPVALALALAWAMGCDRGGQQPPQPPPWPSQTIRAALDRTPAEATALIERAWPGSDVTDTALHRIRIEGDCCLDEWVLFADVRSGRVNAVVLKYRADLAPQRRAEVLALTGVPELASRLEADPVVTDTWEGLRLRARRADRQGRLTLTVEAPPDPATAPH